MDLEPGAEVETFVGRVVGFGLFDQVAQDVRREVVEEGDGFELAISLCDGGEVGEGFLDEGLDEFSTRDVKVLSFSAAGRKCRT